MGDMPAKLEFGDPGDLLFGLNDLAARVRTLKPEEVREWAAVDNYIGGYIDYLSTLTAGSKSVQKPLTGGTAQRLIIALHSLEMARRAAKERATDPAADALHRASRAIGGGTELERPDFGTES